MTDECIHGFPMELCDICSPRQRAEPELAPKRAPVRRRATSLRSTPPDQKTGSARSAASRAAAVAPVPTRVFTEMRALHFTHLDNVDAILADGAIRASSQVTPALDVSSPATRARRAAVATPDGASVADHVPFVLSADATTWDALRTGAEDERWSDAARGARHTDYVMFVVPTVAFGDSVILADTDADDPDARFAVGPEASTSLLRRTDLTDPEGLGVEILAGPSVPFSSVAVIGVPNDRVRDAVRLMLADEGGHAPRVAVFPPWFHTVATD